ncbi:MAG: hypothetical protein Q4E39_05745, partial [bacterium]|nr:hypothetical protein [bacterium]
LAQGKAEEIEKIIKLLKEENIDVRECLTVLARGKAKEIEKIIKLLKEENIDVHECLTVLAYGKAEEIEKIIKLLKEENIDVRECLSVLALGKAEEIEKIIKLLKQENIDIKRIEKNKLYVILYDKYENIEKLIVYKNFSDDDNNLKKYFKLKYDMNKFYTKEEIEKICSDLNIDIYRILDIFRTRNDELKKQYVLNLNNGKLLWLGRNYPCTKEQLEKNKDNILKICSTVSKNFAKKLDVNYMQDELQGFTLDIIMEKCGDIFYSFDSNYNLLFGVLSSYCTKSLYHYIDFKTTKLVDNINGEEEYDYQNVESMDMLNDIDLDDNEQKIVNYMSHLIENGDVNYEDKIKSRYNLNNQNYEDVMNKIKVKVISKKDITT